ncbi:hypothetical protein ABFX02_14G312300 [Erythranthe guttata]
MFDPRTQFSDTYNNHIHDNNIVLNNSSYNNNNNWCSSDQEVVQFRPNLNLQQAMGSDHDDDSSGVCSPPLWKNIPSPSPSPSASPSQPLLSRHVYTSLSPNSRVQAIARGQRELMEMVKNMPESSYELSLKDIVENRHKMENQEDPPRVERVSKNNSENPRILQGKKSNDKNMMRNGSFKNKGLFIKMVMPTFSFQSKKKSNFGGNTNGKVSPKPDVVKGGGGGGGERDWWKKKFTGSSDSDSSRTSINSGSTASSGGSTSSRSYSGSGRKKKNGILTGCWPIFQSRRSKSVAE